MAALFHKSNERADAPPSQRQAESAKPLVLVVEDHEETRFMLAYLLEARGCRVVLAEDGLMAVRLAESQRPDLILMDASLPRLDGLAATRRIRELAALHDVPIIFLSGHAQASFRVTALAAGSNDFIVKPFELDQLGRVLDRHLGREGAAHAR